MNKIKRFCMILLKVGCMSPCLRRRVKFSDIWETPDYMG